MAGNQFDVIVIGTGPGGEGAAMQAVKHGLKVAAVERYAGIGGGCTHWGTIPSKALRFAIFQMTEANNNPLFRQADVSVELEFPQLRKGAESVIRQTPTAAEYDLYSREVAFLTTKASRNLGYRPTIDMARGVDLSAGWLRHHRYVPSIGA